MEEQQEQEQEIISGEELLEAKRKERKIRKTKKKISFLKRMLRFFTGLFIIAGMYYCSLMSGWYLPQSTFQKFDTTRIQVVNNKIVKTSTIQKVMKDLPISHKPIFLNNFGELRKEILALTPIENVYIRRFAFPARIMIIVKEATPIISIAPDEKVSPVAVFTQDAKLITGSDYLPLSNNFKTILVLSYGNKGDDYHNWNLDKIREIEKLTKYIETFSGEKMEYLDLRNPNDVYVKIKSVKIRLGRIDNKVYDKIRLIPSVLPQIKTVDSEVKYIDLRWDSVFLKL